MTPFQMLMRAGAAKATPRGMLGRANRTGMAEPYRRQFQQHQMMDRAAQAQMAPYNATPTNFRRSDNRMMDTGGQNVFEQSAGAYTGGVNSLQYAANPMALGMTMNMLQNPYQEQVIDPAMQEMNEQRDIALNNVQGDAAAAGAFGGSRHGLVEASVYEDSMRQQNDMLNQMLYQGYNTNASLGIASLGQQTNAAGQLVNAAPVGYNMGAGSVGMQNQVGTQQQALMQGILDQGNQQVTSYLGWPQQSLGVAMGGLQGNPLGGQSTSTSTYTPGMYDYASLGAGTYAAGK